MGKIKANGINFYYEVHGSGEPLILIEGLGYSTWMWYKQIEELAKHFKVIVFDNRGVGFSDKPDTEYSIELFAEDTAEILSALGISKAHILGVSMGGFIAQEFAINYPEMVNKLILCSTSFGGPDSIPIPQETLNIMLKGGGEYKSKEEIAEAISIALDEKNTKTHSDVINKIMIEKTNNPQPKYAYQRQLMAGVSFNAKDYLNKVKAETLIIAGKGDRVVPYENSKLLNEYISGSNRVIISNAGHLFFMEQPEITNRLIINFLKGRGLVDDKKN